ncbi:DUF1287 domain-containing protein [bacterium F11]|nr:DUF1287 domain-containing protein [bacterium F11]
MKKYHSYLKKPVWFGILLCLFFSLLHADQNREEKIKKVLSSALEQTKKTFIYDPAYEKLEYPKGDVDMWKGVCTDVVVRAFRAAGVDLQVLVHEDMTENFDVYPKIWGLSKPDKNIDHRRVPNLMTFFKRKGKDVPLSKKATDYQPGDVVAWKLPNERLHVGIVSKKRKLLRKRHLIVHNIGWGTELEDILFKYKIIGHYRYF